MLQFDGGDSIFEQVSFIFLFMKSHNSSFLLTDQTRYSQQLFAKSINRVRNRINILSTTSIITDTNCPQNANKSLIHTNNKSSGLCATMSKLTFDLEMISQDVKMELLQLKKGRQLIVIVAQDIRRKSNATQKQMIYSIQQLEKDTQTIITANNQRNRRLVLQCELRREKGSQLKQKIGEIARRITKIQSSLGCYTANQKFCNIKDQ